jgi:toxin ParE1/3/4
MRVVLSPAAANDLVRIGRFIALNNPAAAQKVSHRLSHVMGVVLSSHPEVGTRRDDVRPGLRVFVVEDHVVCYRLTGSARWVLRIVHGAQDFTRLL